MNQYPLWKYLLILAALVVGLVYTLPNFYGESPAVQVLPLRANLKADAALLGAMHVAAQKIAAAEGLESYRLTVNCGVGAGQTVPHLHMHLLGGRSFGWPPG